MLGTFRSSTAEAKAEAYRAKVEAYWAKASSSKRGKKAAPPKRAWGPPKPRKGVLHAAGDVALPANVLKLAAGLMRGAAQLAARVEPPIHKVDAVIHGHAGRRPRGWGSLVAALRELFGEALSVDEADAALHLLMPPVWLPPGMRDAADADSEEWHNGWGTAVGGAAGEAAALGGGSAGLASSSSSSSTAAPPACNEHGGASRQPPWSLQCSRSPCMVLPLEPCSDLQAAVAVGGVAAEGGDGGGGR